MEGAPVSVDKDLVSVATGLEESVNLRTQLLSGR